MRDIKILGIDLAKNIFQLHGAESRGKCVMRKRLTREKLKVFVAKLSPCVVAIEACTGAHYWARTFSAMGHTVKMMAPQFVKPYVKSNKTDRNDAEAIAEAASRPQMRFVPIKSVEQQDTQLIHRARELVMKQRTAQSNQIRGFLADYGITLPQGIGHVRKRLAGILEDNSHELSALAREIFRGLTEQFKILDEQVEKYDQKLCLLSKGDERCNRLMEIEGIGPITATAIVSAVGNAQVFKNGRELAAWLGLVPRQHSSGNHTRLLGISKRGDRYVRTLLVQGAQSVVRRCGNKQDPRSEWIKDKVSRCGVNKTAVAVANKNARIIWALLSSGQAYRHSRAGMKVYSRKSSSRSILTAAGQC
jgi:transposase